MQEVYDIEKKDVFKIYSKDMIVIAKKVILAPGRLGKLFLNNIANKMKIDYGKNNYVGEIGIIIEMPYNVFSSINNIYNDIKLKRKIDENNEIRTFCQNYRGLIRKCVYTIPNGKLASLDGSIMGKKTNTKSVNIAIRHRKNNIKDIQHFIKMINDVNKENKPIVQSMESFLNNNSYYNFNEKYSTMRDYNIDNINNYLPYDTLNYIKKMIIDIDKMIPGFANKDNIVYAPSFDLGCDRYKLSNNFETNIKGLYIGGDISGYFRGIMQSMISGKIISDDIMKNS